MSYKKKRKTSKTGKIVLMRMAKLRAEVYDTKMKGKGAQIQ